MRAVLVAALILAAVPTVVGCGESDQEFGSLLDNVVAAGAPGVLVVVRDQDGVRSESRGFADANEGVAMRPGLRFRIGSVTKTFVAALVLQLVEDSKLRLDDTVNRWLPGLVPGGRSITVRQLLSHTAGLFDYVEDPRIFQDRHRRWRPRQLVVLATTHPPEHATPGRGFAYSSTNYVVLGLIAEAATHVPLRRLLRERLFEPLDLHSTSFVPGVIRGRHVHGHRRPSHQGVVTGRAVDTSDEPAWWTWAAGAIVSTAKDVQDFYAALLHGQVIGPRLLHEMETLVPAGRLQYGLGLATFPTPCGRAWGHTGNVQGTIVVAWNTQDAARQVVVVVNTYPLTGELEGAITTLDDAAFCSAA